MGSMQVSRVSFVGVRTTAFDATVGLFRDVLGMEPAFANPGWVGFRLPSGSAADDGWCFFWAPDGNVYVLQQDGLGGRG